MDHHRATGGIHTASQQQQEQQQQQQQPQEQQQRRYPYPLSPAQREKNRACFKKIINKALGHSPRPATAASTQQQQRHQQNSQQQLQQQNMIITSSQSMMGGGQQQYQAPYSTQYSGPPPDPHPHQQSQQDRQQQLSPQPQLPLLPPAQEPETGPSCNAQPQNGSPSATSSTTVAAGMSKRQVVLTKVLQMVPTVTSEEFDVACVALKRLEVRLNSHNIALKLLELRMSGNSSLGMGVTPADGGNVATTSTGRPRQQQRVNIDQLKLSNCSGFKPSYGSFGTGGYGGGRGLLAGRIVMSDGSYSQRQPPMGSGIPQLLAASGGQAVNSPPIQRTIEAPSQKTGEQTPTQTGAVGSDSDTPGSSSKKFHFNPGYNVARQSETKKTTDATFVHPLQTSEEQRATKIIQGEVDERRRLGGQAMAMQYHKELNAAAQISRCPGNINGSQLHTEMLLGCDESIGFEDYLNKV